MFDCFGNGRPEQKTNTVDVKNDHPVLYVCARSYNKQNGLESLGPRGQLRCAAVSYYIIVNCTYEIQYAYRRCFVWDFRTRSYVLVAAPYVVGTRVYNRISWNAIRRA